MPYAGRFRFDWSCDDDDAVPLVVCEIQRKGVERGMKVSLALHTWAALIE